MPLYLKPKAYVESIKGLYEKMLQTRKMGKITNKHLKIHFSKLNTQHTNAK